MIVTISRSLVIRCSNSEIEAPSRVPLTVTIPSPRTRPIQSPTVIGPASLLVSRIDCVTSPVTIASVASAISAKFSSALASGSYTMSAASASGIDLVSTTRTSFVVNALSCSATGMMFLLLGNTMTCCAFTCSTASSNSAVDGFRVCPPVTTPCTPSCAKSSSRPLPLHTATTAVVTAGKPAAARCASCVAWRSATSSNRSVTRICFGRPPRSIATSMAAPMSLV